MTVVRQSAVAGMFYSDKPSQLSAEVRSYMDAVEPWQGPVPKAIIVPHAGYVYSGPVAASAYARLVPGRGVITRVVLLGPCHRVPVKGIAASGAEAFLTPLGQVPVDREAVQGVLDLPFVGIYDPAHAMEHCLEVHLPFLQEILGDFSIVPFVVGQAEPEEVARLLERLWGGPETVVVVSSDLSHYLDYDRARQIDDRTRKAIEALDGNAIEDDGACGRYPVRGLLALARRRGMAVETVDIRNSGDTAGPKDRVVGYGAWAFTEGGRDG